MLTSLATWWDRIPATVRDFVEAVLGAGIVAGLDALVGIPADKIFDLNHSFDVFKLAFVIAAIAKARHALARPE